MARLGARRYSLELASLERATVAVRANWTDEECRIALDDIFRLESRMPTDATRLYWIQIKDDRGALRLFTTWDWTAVDRRIAWRKIRRLARPRNKATRHHADQRHQSHEVLINHLDGPAADSPDMVERQQPS